MKIIIYYIKRSSMNIACLFIFWVTLNGCEKFLDAKPNQKLATPSTVEDAQALLDHYTIMNLQGSAVGANSDDDFYLLDTYITSRDINSQNIYTWQKEVEEDKGWKGMYKVVLN